MKVVVASKNPVKVQATKDAFEKVFRMTIDPIPFAADSGVASQPVSDAQTLQGARNRLAHAKEKKADFFVAIEGGIERVDSGYEAFAWVVVEHDGKLSRARTATFPLPEGVVELIDQGHELGHACDIFFDQQNSKHKEGAVGILTHGLIDRTKYYVHALILALCPFR